VITLQPTPVPFDLPRFEELLGADRTRKLRSAASLVRAALAGGTLWHVNSTGAGGGVAEMLHTLLPLYARLEVPARWAVVGSNHQFFTLTKRLGLGLYGSAGAGGPLGRDERDDYLTGLSATADQLLELIRPGDVVVLHDHQTAGLVPPLARHGARIYWRCHVGVDTPTEHSERAWAFLDPLLEDADTLLFSVPWHVPERLRGRPTAVLPPFISPFSPKNRDMTPMEVAEALARSGLSRGNGPEVVSEAAPAPKQPLITQVSRWDRLKDMHGVLAAVTTFVPEGYLALVGPDPRGVPDDVEQALWFDRCLTAWRALPLARRRRAALLTLPMDDLTENAVLVNAIQRASAVVIQKSLAEGFGLTVTEAMWKRRVVVASGVGGIREQVEHGRTGFLVDDPHDLPGFAAAVSTALAPGTDTTLIGSRARDRVLEAFLPDRDVSTMARLLTGEGDHTDDLGGTTGLPPVPAAVTTTYAEEAPDR
jgi:trehalose synthase